MPKWVMYLDPVPSVPELRLIGRAQNPRGGVEQSLPPHRHQFMEISYVHRGTLRWWVNREWSDVRGGDVYVTWPGEPHGGSLGSLAGCTLYWLHIPVAASSDPTFLGLPPSEASALSSSLANLPRRHFQVPDIAQIFDRLLDAIPADGPLAATSIRADLLGLLLAMVRAAGESTMSMSPMTAQVVALMRSQLHARLDLASIAAALGKSKSHIKQRFRRDVGVGPAEYHLRLRIEEAQRRLRSTNEPVIAIACDLGFSSSQYFATAFKRLAGVSPLRYRAGLELWPGQTSNAPLAIEPQLR